MNLLVMFFLIINYFYVFFSRDYVDSKDIFARDASIVNETRQQKLFISDLVKFDIIQSKSLYFNYIMYNTSFFL